MTHVFDGSPLQWHIYLAVIGIGFAAGFINTLAGGGSALSLPMLIFTGLPANVANGTNRIAILLQTLVASLQFKKDKILKIQPNLPLIIPAVLGAVPGAFLAVNLNEAVMRKVIGVVLLIMLAIVILKPDLWIKSRAGLLPSKSNWVNMLVFFCIGAYGGFIQVGVGFFLLAGLVLINGMNLLHSNALKVLLVLLYTPMALGVFILNGQVDYILGFVLAIGNMAGAFVAAKTAVKWGPKFIRYILIAALILSSLKLLNLI
jgi:uncharacterized membrane protein YfcA